MSNPNDPRWPGQPNQPGGVWGQQPQASWPQGAPAPQQQAAPPAYGSAFQNQSAEPYVVQQQQQQQQQPLPEIPKTTPPEIAKRIKRAGIVKLLGLLPLLFALLPISAAVGALVLDSLSEEWLFDRDQQEDVYKGYQRCQETKEDSVYCRSILSKKSPSPPPKVQDAPSYVIQDNTYKRISLFSFGGALLSCLLGAAIYLAGRARQNSARREDPSRVVIGHSRALEILVWIGGGFFGTIAIIKGLAGRSAEAAPFIAVGLAAFAFIIIFQLVLHVFRPSEADADGLRLGFGRRLLWKNFQQKTSVTVKRQNRTVSFYYKLHFKNGSVSVDPVTTSNFERLKRFINEGVGRDVV